MKAYRGSGDVALLIMNISARWKWSGFRPGRFTAGKYARYSKIICARAMLIALRRMQSDFALRRFTLPNFAHTNVYIETPTPLPPVK